MNGRWEEKDRQQLNAPLPTVLVVDDDPMVRRALGRALTRLDVRPIEAGDVAQALELLQSERIEGVIADQRLEDGSGVDLLATVRNMWPELSRVLITGLEDPRIAQLAINQAGVSYFLGKPWEADAIEEVVNRLPKVTEECRPNRTRPSSTGFRSRFPGIIGESLAMRELLELVRKIAETDSTALITGETGTGKELIGRAIHEASRRSDRVFSAVNSAAFPETLLESELFGHRRGAFTGATSNSKGLFEHADRGTVFLDEVAEMPLSMQAKLLRFLQTGEIRPVGDEATRYVDVRLVTATNKDLEVEVAEGRFREDLYYRLAVIPVHVPALRERVEDIPLLARHFLARMATKANFPIEEIDDAALDRLAGYHWPGNVRELENAIERAVALSRSGRIEVDDLPLHVREPKRLVLETGIQSLPGVERRHILETLDKVGWNRKRAAELLQISTTTLWRRLKEFGIEGDARVRTSRFPLNG
ncbi:MAG: sigma-54-dependent Fis family transcriptional regulator [bacterium]|nr:sigma-54-dependent Fis family transcriptional regulator [bacterium]